MERSDNFQKILGLPLLQDMPDEAREHIADLFLDVSEPSELSDGSALVHEGWLAGDTGFILLQGNVEVDKDEAGSIALSAPVLLGEMGQFNPCSERTATVYAKGDSSVAIFSWRELYAKARECLTEEEQNMLMDAVEHCVLDRFDRETFIDLALFRGIPAQLRLRGSLVLQWIVHRVTVADGECLFKQDDSCGATGYVLFQGKIKLTKQNYPEQTIEAPDILGVMPKFNPDLKWTATATAEGNVELLKFSWQEYTAFLKQRLSEQELSQFMDSITESAKNHFVN